MKKINHVLNQKIIKKSLTNLMLREQSETEKFVGFEEVPNNSDALKFKSTSAPNMKAALDKANIPTDKRSEYFMIKSHYDSFTKEEKLGKTGKELGISKDNDPYTYDDLGGGKYKVISGPAAKAIGKVFSMPKKSASDAKEKSDKEYAKISDEKTSVKFTYTVGNTETVDGIKGTKFLKRKENDKKIIKTFLMPDDLDSENIMSRVAPDPFKKETNQKELIDAANAYEKETGKKIKGLDPILPEKGKKMPPSEFFGTFGPIVKSAARGTDVFPSVTLAQAAIETGWGKSTVGDANNMFGIKAKGKTNQYWTGDAVKKSTTEYYDGVKGKYNLAFRKYNSLKDSILDHNLFLKVNKRYGDALKATTPESQARLIHKAGYATDPNYSDKIISMIKKYNLKQYDDEILAAKSKDSTTAVLAENSSKRKKMILREEKLRKIIRRVLMEATEKFEDYIKDQKSGNDFRAWVNKNKPDIAKKHDLDETGSFNNSYIKNAWEDVGDEYTKEKKAETQKKKNLDTGGKMIMAQGDGKGEPGTYSPGRGMENRYYKFYIDDIVIAVDELTGKMGQLKRGVGSNFEITPINESVRKVKNYLFKENYINPAKVYADIKRGNYEAPAEAGKSIKNNVEFQQKIIAKEKQISKSTKSVKDSSSSSKTADPKLHTFINEEELPIKFKQLDMSACANMAKQLFSEWGSLTEKDGYDFLLNKIIMPTSKAFGSNWPESKIKTWTRNATKDVSGHAWSSWFLNRCLIENDQLKKLTQSLQDGYEAKGMVYPWSYGNKSRKSIENDMEGSIGDVRLVVFSREEIEARSDLNFSEGIFTLNAYASGAGDSFKVVKNRFEHGSGLHMNVVTSQGPIGGNRGSKGTISNQGSVKGYNCYYILVKVLPNQPTLT